MKQKLISSILCLILLLVMFLGSTLAWFTDQSQTVNTMVAGQISIQQRDETPNIAGVIQLKPGENFEKIITVTNTGTRPCYVRTLFAFEDSEAAIGSNGETVANYIIATGAQDGQVVIPGVNGDGEKVTFAVQKGEKTTRYVVGYYSHPAIVEKDCTITSLRNIELSSKASKAWMDQIGDTYEILVFSQAVQATAVSDGTETALAAETIFGAVNRENVTKWFAYILGGTVSAESADTILLAVSK